MGGRQQASGELAYQPGFEAGLAGAKGLIHEDDGQGLAGVCSTFRPRLFALDEPRQGLRGISDGHRWRRLYLHGRFLEPLGGLPNVIGALLSHPHAGIAPTFHA